MKHWHNTIISVKHKVWIPQTVLVCQTQLTVAKMTKDLALYHAGTSLGKSYPDLHWKILVQEDFSLLIILISTVTYPSSVEKGTTEISWRKQTPLSLTYIKTTLLLLWSVCKYWAHSTSAEFEVRFHHL